MDAATAVSLIQFLEENGLDFYVDGGWAVDALLGEQTRHHDDLDIALRHSQVNSLRKLLAARGFCDLPRADSWECNFVLADDSDNRIDVHSFTLDEAGNNIFGIAYVGRDLTGRGSIHGHVVRCICPASLVKFHTGYAVDGDDYHDVRLLCEKFGVEIPPDYEKFVK
jgi:lincosamide nucleotidyltransferase A/C/D/E